MSDDLAELLHLDPALIDIPDDRLREVDPEKVKELASSFKEIGQITPIEVFPGTVSGRYTLNAGAHRLSAALESELPSIMALVFDGTADQRRIREIDENLYRAELTPYDQAAFLAERRAIYERLNGRVKAGRKARTGNSDNLSQLSFFDDVTAKFGLPRRTVERSLRRMGKISSEIWYALRGHPITKKASELDKLSKLNDAEQRKVVRLLLQLVHPAKNVTAALRSLSDDPVVSVDDKQYQKLLDAWGKAGAKAKREFLEFVDRKAVRDAI